MNALELADELEAAPYYTFFEGEAAAMLRQQHAEIETLKLHGYRTQYELLRIEFIQQQTEIEALKAEATKLVMAEHCTCYKLGYSPLNDYAAVK
jgi:hypothetical protein